jgi:hypothetical protein
MKKSIILLSILLAVTFLIPPVPAKAGGCNCWYIQDELIFISECELDFNRCTIDTIPRLGFYVERWRQEFNIQASIKSNIPWLIVEQVRDEPEEKAFTFRVDPKLVAIGLFNDIIMVITDVGNYAIPVRLDLVEKKVNMKFFIGKHLALIDGREVPIKEPAFLRDEWPWIPLQLVVDTIGGTIEYERDSEGRMINIYVNYKDLHSKLEVCYDFEMRNNQAFISWWSLWCVFQCKISYELSENMVEIEY